MDTDQADRWPSRRQPAHRGLSWPSAALPALLLAASLLGAAGGLADTADGARGDGSVIVMTMTPG